MARTYEGSKARLRDMVRRTILGQELIVSAIGGSVTNGHQVDASETWINKLTDWFNTFMPPPEDFTKMRAREKAQSKKQKQKQSEEEQEGWRTVQASENGWKGINGAVPGEHQAVEPGRGSQVKLADVESTFSQPPDPTTSPFVTPFTFRRRNLT
jgi:hypothetical protein